MSSIFSLYIRILEDIVSQQSGLGNEHLQILVAPSIGNLKLLDLVYLQVLRNWDFSERVSDFSL